MVQIVHIVILPDKEMAETELQVAVKAGDLATLQKLLDSGVNLDVKDEDERTPLHWACATGRLDVAEFLLEHAKAAVNVQDDAGWTLHERRLSGPRNIVGLLLSK